MDCPVAFRFSANAFAPTLLDWCTLPGPGARGHDRALLAATSVAAADCGRRRGVRWMQLCCEADCERTLPARVRLPGDLDRATPTPAPRAATSGLVDRLAGEVDVAGQRVRVHAVGLVHVARPRCGGHDASGARSHIRSRRRPRSTSSCSMDAAVPRDRPRMHPAGSRSTARRPGSGYSHTRTAGRHRRTGRLSGR